MKVEDTKQLVRDLAALVRFHELDTVDSRAVELLHQASEIENTPLVNESELDEWIEEVRVANMHELT